MRKPGFTIFALISLSIMITSCTPAEICLSNQHAVQIGIRSSFMPTRDTALANVSVRGLGVDSFIHEEARVSQMFLPLSFSNDTTAFVLSSGTRVDTLWISHRGELYFISRECGFTWNLTVDSVWFSGSIIDSAYIDYPPVNYGENFENFALFVF